MQKRSPIQAAEYVEAQLRGLEQIARDAGLQTLAYLIGIAALEARNVRRPDIAP
jgi:hypothetical protein